MITYAAVAAILTGILANIGGILAFVKVKSRPSLIAGVVVGDVLTIGGALVLFDYSFGLWLAVAGAAALLGRFVPVWLKAPSRLWPGFVMAAGGAITLTLALVALLG